MLKKPILVSPEGEEHQSEKTKYQKFYTPYFERVGNSDTQRESANCRMPGRLRTIPRTYDSSRKSSFKIMLQRELDKFVESLAGNAHVLACDVPTLSRGERSCRRGLRSRKSPSQHRKSGAPRFCCASSPSICRERNILHHATQPSSISFGRIEPFDQAQRSSPARREKEHSL